MDENKTMNNLNPDGAGEKTFSQEDVNRIVDERLAKEKAKGEAALAEREQQLAQRELLLTAKEKLTENGLPVELVDALNVSSNEALEKALSIVKTVLDKYKSVERLWGFLDKKGSAINGYNQFSYYIPSAGG